MFQAGNSATGITNQVQMILVNLRNALVDAEQANLWAQGVSMGDLINAGFAPDPGDPTTSPDAQALKSALADAAALKQLAYAGSLPDNYPPDYVFVSSLLNIIGARAT
jgi:hypothetical protein